MAWRPRRPPGLMARRAGRRRPSPSPAQDRVRRRSRGHRRQQDQRHQGRPRGHDPGPQGGQGPGRGGPQGDQDGHLQGRRREAQEGARGRRRHRQDQVIRVDAGSLLVVGRSARPVLGRPTAATMCRRRRSQAAFDRTTLKLASPRPAGRGRRCLVGNASRLRGVPAARRDWRGPGTAAAVPPAFSSPL